MSEESEGFSLRKISITALGSILICTAVTWARWPDKLHWTHDKTTAVVDCAKGQAFPGWLDPVHLAEQFAEDAFGGGCQYKPTSQAAITRAKLNDIERQASVSCARYGGLAKIEWPYSTRPSVLENHDDLAYRYLHRRSQPVGVRGSTEDIAISMMLSNGEKLPNVKRYRELEAVTREMNEIARMPASFSKPESTGAARFAPPRGLPAKFDCKDSGIVHRSIYAYVP
jgi:hypothetical protein